MIARLTGALLDRQGTHIVIDCGGVGYEVICSGYTLSTLPSLGERTSLRIFTHATENKIVLFGFGDAAERALFDLLITVKNVGPSTAIAMLSGGAAPRDLAGLIAREEVSGLTRIKGIGKKTAELMIVELHEKCEMLLLTWTASGIADGGGVMAPSNNRPRRSPLLDEVSAALINLGWRPAEADKAVADLEIDASSTLEPLIRQALRNMPR